MNRPLWSVAFFVVVYVMVLAGCVGKVPPALTANAPTSTEVQQLRAQAIRIAENTSTALVIIDQAAQIANVSSLPTSIKDAIDCSIIRATGLSGPPSPTVQKVCGMIPPGPGVLHEALGVLSDVTSQPSLRATVVGILAVLDPLLGQLEAAGNPTLTGFAAVLRVSLVYARQFLGGA